MWSTISLSVKWIDLIQRENQQRKIEWHSTVTQIQDNIDVFP